MKIIRKSNVVYYGSIVGMAVSPFVMFFGLWNYAGALFTIGGIILILSIYLFANQSKYKLVLSKGYIKEKNSRGVFEQRFTDIRQLDCEVIMSTDTLIVYPVFYLLRQDGSEIDFKTSAQVSLHTVADWVRVEYPNAVHSKNVQEIIRKTKPKLV